MRLLAAGRRTLLRGPRNALFEQRPSAWGGVQSGYPAMIKRLVLAAALAVSPLLLTSCGEDEAVADIAFADIRAAFDPADAAAYRSAFDQYRGKRVAWQGHVAEAIEVVGDDYIRTGLLLVDMDGPDADPRAGDVALDISAADIAKYQPGQPVSFTLVLREYDVDQGKLVLKGELKDLK